MSFKIQLKKFLKKYISRKVFLTFFFSFIAVKMFFCAFLVYLYGIYIFPLDYSLMGFRFSYIVGLMGGFIVIKYWEKFIKRKLHFILIGDNNKI